MIIDERGFLVYYHCKLIDERERKRKSLN